MTVKELVEILKNPHRIDEGQARELDDIVQEYPYFQAARMLQLKMLHSQGDYRYSKALKLASIHVSDRTILYDFIHSKVRKEQIEKKMPVMPQPQPAFPEKEVAPVVRPTITSAQLQENALQQSINPLKEQIILLQKQIKSMQSQENVLHNQENTLQKQISALQMQINSLQHQDNPLKKQINSLQEQLISMQKQENPLEKQMDLLQKQIGMLLQQKNPLERQINSLQDQINLLQKQENPLERQMDLLQKQIGVLLQQKNPLERQINSLQEQISSLQKQENPLERQINLLQEQISSLQKQENPLEKQINALQEQIGILLKQENPLEKQISSLQQQISSLQQQENPLQRQINLLQLQMGNLQRQGNPLEKQMTSLQEQINSLQERQKQLLEEEKPAQQPVSQLPNLAPQLPKEEKEEDIFSKTFGKIEDFNPIFVPKEESDVKPVDEPQNRTNETTSKPISKWLEEISEENDVLQRNHDKQLENKEDKIAEKFRLIDKFLESNPKIEPSKDYVSNVNLADEVKTDTHQLMTETLAQVYVNQRKFKLAIQAYEILILKNPEKSAYFASQIQKIKNLQQNNL